MINLLENINVTQTSLIENCILNIQLKEDVEKNLKDIKKILNSSFDNCECEDISISDSNNTSILYGMRVYPSTLSLELLAMKVMDPKVSTQDLTKRLNESTMKYVVEIDSNLLYNKIYNFKPGEITAILLHEIGHVTSDSDFYNDLKSYYNNALFTLENVDLAKKNISRDDAMVGSLFILSSIEKTRVQYNANNNIELEKIADKFVVKCGYGEQLTSAMKKFNKIYMSQYKKTNKDSSLKSEAEAFAHLNNVFKTRTNYVLGMLKTEEKVTTSNLVKATIDKVRKYITRRNFSESLNVTIDVPLMDKEFITEGFLNKWLGNPLKVSQMDIDDLKIESEMMEDYDDKSILVFKIHKRINQINKAIEKSDESTSTNIVGKNYLNQLNELLKNVMKFNATPKRYGVFIKYPKGYEG